MHASLEKPLGLSFLIVELFPAEETLGADSAGPSLDLTEAGNPCNPAPW